MSQRGGAGPVIAGLDPATYESHVLHASDRDWPETNCYIDVWIELIAALGLSVEACLSFPLALDFEGDQWTFFKPPHADLELLYGIRVEELMLWRPLLDHAVTQVRLGRILLVEVDSFHLPDTAGTDYGVRHGKTTIGIVGLDAEARQLHYFHNRGLHALEGKDFDSLFRPGEAATEYGLPPYCEIVKLAGVETREEASLRACAREIARHHHARRPRANPVRAYEQVFDEHLEWVKGQDLDRFHAYGFASLRQLGAGFELLAAHLRWLGGPCADVAERFTSLSADAKTLLLQVARVANSGRHRDLTSRLEVMADAWDDGMNRLGPLLDA